MQCFLNIIFTIIQKHRIFRCFVFRRSLFDSILELCRTRRTRLYVLREMKQIRLQMKTNFFMEKLGSRSKSCGKRLCLCRETPVVFFQFFWKRWKKEDQCTSISHFADRPELPYEVDFRRNRFPTKISFQKIWRFFLAFWEGGFGCFLKDFFGFVKMLAWNRDGKCCQGVN